MKVRFIWPDCDYHNGQWSEPKQDSFWLECSPSEVKGILAPHMTAQQREAVGQAHRPEQGSPPCTFLISRDLSSIWPTPPNYPLAGLWNGYCPFIEMPEQVIKSLSEVSTLPPCRRPLS
ncbi:MAG: hypothetical protein AMXMBFR7_51540 [Planctomycetota bacterium]